MGLLHRLFFLVLCRGIRAIIALRYRVVVKGFADVLALKKTTSGILFLPNHPAEIDPILLMSILGPHFYPRGVIVEHFYHLKGFKRLLDCARVIPLPSMDEKANRWRKKELEKSLAQIHDGLAHGENFMIYPAGRLKRTGFESIGGASLAHGLIEGKEDIPLVLVRTTGLWGSSFSTYQTGKSPDFAKVLSHALKVVLKNGIFFVPKRRLEITFAVNPTLPRKEERLVFNRALESWYNQYPEKGAEPAILVPYRPFGKAEVISPEEKILEKEEDIVVSSRIEEAIFSLVSTLSKIPKEKITQEARLSHDLGLDSLDIAEIYVFLDKEYDAAWVPLEELKKVRDLFRAIADKEKNRTKKQGGEEKHFPSWFEKKERKPLQFSQGKVLSEVFLRSCRRMGSCVACADALSGVFSYKKLQRSSLVLARAFLKLPGKRVGVLLPSSVGAYLVIVALWLAGKVPVMLNWTAGEKALTHALRVGEFSVTLTSRRFLDRIHLEEMGEIEETFLLLETIKGEISWKEKVQGLFWSFRSVEKIVQKYPVEKDPLQTAVLLFTSGSESLPKAVPLSHVNLLSNERNSVAFAALQKEEALYGVLPPFHSFGFSLTGVLPLLYGLKVFYAPDPTDGHVMAADIEKMQLQLLCSAPSFLSALFSLAKPSQLQGVRLVVSGAEKPPASIPAFVREHMPKADWMEGYGITECSPVVTLHSRGDKNQGVGKCIPGTELYFIDPVSLEALPRGEIGEICICGDGVFSGYLGENKDPFLCRDGKRWYRSGDLGYVDEENTLYIVERLKRTVKIGGEMLSLGAVEQELIRVGKEKLWYSSLADGPVLAVISTKAEKPELILFSTFSISLEEVNASLRESGLCRLAKISRVVQVGGIPIMGTGKMHYRLLEEQLESSYV